MLLLRPVNPKVVSRSTIARAMSSAQTGPAMRFQFSAGEDEEQLSRSATALTTTGGGRWKPTDDNRGLERTFRFKTFKATWVSIAEPQKSRFDFLSYTKSVARHPVHGRYT